jgi:hypothetical protein
MRIPLLAVVVSLACIAAGPKVTLVRCPNEGVQPQAAVDESGRIHLIYLKGAEAESDVNYVRSDDAAKTWSSPIRVNSQPGAAIAVGTVRGAHLSLGRGGEWMHVAWMGSSKAQPKAPGDSTPMLYARMKRGQTAFEPQRNVIAAHPGLDGGGSVAADDRGNVYVAWHAPGGLIKGEAGRAVFVAQSSDDGGSFSPERDMMADKTGVCGCCGMRAFVDADGQLVTLYRAANERTRDIYLLRGGRGTLLGEWAIKTCPMSTATFARAPNGLLAAWETAQQVWLKRLDAGEPIHPPGEPGNRKHPSVAINPDGVVLLAWSEGTGWKRGGSVAWQAFDPENLKPLEAASGVQKGLAVWSLPSVVYAGEGFVVVY